MLNGEKTSLKAGERKEVAEGTTLCYGGGEGKVVIPALKRQLKKTGQCLMVPLSESGAAHYASALKSMANIAFWDSTESVRHGAGTKGETAYEKEGVIVLGKDQNELVIAGKEFGPLPVTAVLKSPDGKEVARYENDESEVTVFRIGRNTLSDGMKIELYNGFEELMLTRRIRIDE